MKCDIAQDLLTLYAENLCSPESATELKKHLETCETCSQKLKNYKSEIDGKIIPDTTTLTESAEELKPMKKVRKKLKHRKILIICLCLLLLAMLSGIGILSYGQITNNCMSFSSLADVYKLNKVTKAYVNGDSQPLIDILSFTLEEIYALEKTTDYESFEEYEAYLKNKLDLIYEKYLKNKKVTIEPDGIYYEPYDLIYYIDSPTNAYCYAFYDENGEYIFSMDFAKLGTNRYNLSDFSSYGEKNIFNEEFVNYLLPTENVLTTLLLSYPAKNTYTALTEDASASNPCRYFSILIRHYDEDAQPDKAGAYKIQLEEKINALYEDGLYFKDVLFAVDTFDAQSGHWIYKVMFEIENQSNKETCVMECYFRYYNYRLFVIPAETPTLIGTDAITPKQATQLITLFDL